MNKFKKLMGLMLAGALAISMAACGSSSSSSQVQAGSEAASTADSSTAASTAATGDKLKMVVCVGWINDLSFYQSTYDGSQRVLEELGDYYEVEVVEMGTDSTVWTNALYDVADEGADIIVTVGYQNKEAFETIPLEYPETKFILFDQDIDFTVGDLSNVLAVTFDSNESGFLAGAAAAYYTLSDEGNTDKVLGFVGGYDSVTINNFLVGYAEGAHYVDPEIEVLSAYVGGFSDTAKAKDLAQAQIASGADVVFQVAGGAGNGVFEAATENDGVKAIGVDADQYEVLAGTNLQDCIMTSSLKRVDNALFKICEDYITDAASVPFGENIVYGLEQDAVGIVFNDNLTATIGEENVQNVLDILEQIKSGDIVVTSATNLSSEEIQAIVAG